MLPIGDDNSSRRTFPIITYALIAVNLLFFFFELAGGDAFIISWSFVPKRFLSNPAAEFITIFTSMFMHAGWVHILGNMLYLWIFGDNVEDRFGHFKYLLFYLACGVAAYICAVHLQHEFEHPEPGSFRCDCRSVGRLPAALSARESLHAFFQDHHPRTGLGGVGILDCLQILSGAGVAGKRRSDRRSGLYGAHRRIPRRD